MTQAQQARFADILAKFSVLHPDWRIGQIIANVSWWARGPTNDAIWEVNDEEFLAAAEAHLAGQQPRSKTA